MALGLAIFAGASVVRAYASYKQAEAQNLQTRYQIRAAEFNADILDLEADYARKAALKEERKHRRNLSQFIGTQRARMGGSGFAIDSASYTGLIDSAIEMGEADALAIRYEGELQAWRAETQARAFRTQAGALETARIDPFLAAGTSLLGSAPGAVRAFGK